MMSENSYSGDVDCGKRKRMSSGLYVSCPHHIKTALDNSQLLGYHFIVTQVIHPNFIKDDNRDKFPLYIGRTDRVLSSQDWNRNIVGEISSGLNVDSEIEHVRRRNKSKLLHQLGFATHLGLPAILLNLEHGNNVMLGQILNSKLVSGTCYYIWIGIPMVHSSRFSPIVESDEKQDTWKWWNNLRRYCNYDQKLGLVLTLPDVKNIPTSAEIDRWLGEPVKALVISTSDFIPNRYGKLVLARAHQEIIQRFISINVQYIIKSKTNINVTMYNDYISFLGKKLHVQNNITDYTSGYADFLQNPLQPLADHLETHVYEVFEKDQIKYTEYQTAIHKAVEDIPSEVGVPVVMVLGAGRGPLVQATLNVSRILHRPLKVYAVEKNPYAVNTLIDRVENEWNNQVTLISEDMRLYHPPEKADIIVSELLGSFGDNELSPECLDGAQRFLKPDGIVIPNVYTSFLAPLHSLKIYNEIKAGRLPDKPFYHCFEMPYVIHIVNAYQIAPSQPLFRYSHPNWDQNHSNERFKKLRFVCNQDCVLTAFAGFFDTLLYKDVMLSINPETHTKTMVSWFPIIFPIGDPVQVTAGSLIEISFWRLESSQKVWYEWCLESPVKGTIMNPKGRSFAMKKF